jgi:hypothetical protein
MKGASRRSAWLRGHIDFGSNQVISDLKIGDAGSSAVYNKAGATHTLFERVRFRGGGGTPGGPNAPVVMLGGSKACSFITFTDCEVERNIGTESPTDLYYGNCYNDITVMSIGTTAATDILFDGCHVGVTNGTASGSPRMGIECYSETGSVGWKNITLRDCTFEAADAHTIDFSDEYNRRATGVLVEGCLIKGGGVKHLGWGYGIDLELPLGAVIRNNTFWRSWGMTFYMTTRDDAYVGAGAVITGNLFDLAYDNGITPDSRTPITLRNDGNQFTGNTITLNYATRAMDLRGCHGNIVTGNVAHLGGRPLTYEYDGSSGNTISGNTVD